MFFSSRSVFAFRSFGSITCLLADSTPGPTHPLLQELVSVVIVVVAVVVIVVVVVVVDVAGVERLTQTTKGDEN